MKKRILAVVFVLLLLVGAAFAAETPTAAWNNFRNSETNMAITTAPVPTDPTCAVERWTTAESLISGSGWNVNNPAPPLIVNGKLITTSGNLLVELDCATGAVLRTAQMEDVCGTLGNSAPTYGSGMLFMPLQNGKVQAFDAITLEPAWCSESLGTQCTTGLVYRNGYVYGCTGNSAPGKVFCLKVEDENKEACQEKTAVWAIYDEQDDTGAYWSTPFVTDCAIVYGTDSGFLLSRSVTDGALISRLALPGGKQRSAITFANGRVYGGTSSGYLFSAALAQNGTLSDLRSHKEESVTSVNSAPLVYNGVVYYGGSKQILAADAVTLKTLRTTGTTGFAQPKFGGAVQSSFLLREKDGCVYLYATQNCEPGGLYLVADSGETMTASALHTPDGEKQNYCLASPICDEAGTIYYRNDSGYLFAVGAKQEAPTTVMASVSVLDHQGAALYAKTEKELPEGATAYDLLLQTGLEVDAVSSEYGMYVRAIGNLAEKTTKPYRYWMYEVNGTSPTVGASSYVLQEGDAVCWKYYVEEEPAPPAMVTASVKVTDHTGKARLKKSTFTLPEGSTVYDLLLETGLDVGAVSTDFGMYVRAIDGLAEKAFGEGSGWTYTVNNKTPMVSVSEWILKDGEYVRWEYVAPNAPKQEVPEPEKEQPAPEKPLPYTDVLQHWAADAIRFVTERNLMNGVSADCFAPNTPLTRGMLAVILHRYAGGEKAAPAEFTDVSRDAWFAQGVDWAAEHGIALGSGGKFLPNEHITREQLAVMLWRYAKPTQKTEERAVFADEAQISPWARDAVSWAASIGILTGRTDATVCPGQQATRAEAAAMLQRFAAWMEER